jgi:hypothetical protein
VTQRLSAIVAVVFAGSVCGCARLDAQLQQHREKLESLGATTSAIGEAWLAGSISGTYTHSALEQTLLLVEKERSALGSKPQAILDPRGAEMSEAAGRLSRLIAVTMHDVEAADADGVRRHLGEVPIAPAKRP